MALALLALVVGLLADMAARYSSIILFSQEKDGVARAASSLQAIGREVEQGFYLLAPGSSTPSDVLAFSLVDSDKPARGDASTALPTWEPRRERDLLTVRYGLTDQNLVRSVTPSELVSTVVASEISGFSCRLEEEARTVVLEASIQEDRRVKTVMVKAFRWAR